MAYEKTNWQTGDIVTAAKLNKIEDNISNIDSTLSSLISRNITSIDIPSGVTKIGKFAFFGCELTSVIIPDGVITIEEYAFYGCHSITEIYIPSSVLSIGTDAFGSVSALHKVVINCGFAEGAVSGAPWGAVNPTINYNVPAPSAE